MVYIEQFLGKILMVIVGTGEGGNINGDNIDGSNDVNGSNQKQKKGHRITFGIGFLVVLFIILLLVSIIAGLIVYILKRRKNMVIVMTPPQSNVQVYIIFFILSNIILYLALSCVYTTTYCCAM